MRVSSRYDNTLKDSALITPSAPPNWTLMLIFCYGSNE